VTEQKTDHFIAVVATYLSVLPQAIRYLIAERRAAESAETLFVADGRQNANRMLELGFQYRLTRYRDTLQREYRGFERNLKSDHRAAPPAEPSAAKRSWHGVMIPLPP
jgi:hypothetical protein